MASWKSYYKRRYRRYYKKKYGNTYTKRSYGQLKAAKQQSDQASFVINVPTEVSCFSVKSSLSYMNNFTGEYDPEEVVNGTYALNIYDLLRKSEFYKSYANMYDEFKIDNIKVKLIPVKYNVTVGGNNTQGYQSFTVYTAWDRTGLNSNQVYLNVDGNYDGNYIDGLNKNEGKNWQFIGKKTDNAGLYCIVGEDITTYSSAESRQVSVGQNNSIVRWLKPKSMAEKSQWLSTSSLKLWYHKYDHKKGCYQYIPTYFDQKTDIQEIVNIFELGGTGKSQMDLECIKPYTTNNPCFLVEDPSITFKPTLLIGLYPTEEQNPSPRVVYFNVEAEISCTFRGLRKSRVV